MGALQEIFRTHGPRYIERFGAAMPYTQQKVIEAIIGCRTEASGALLYQCEGCEEQHVVPRCCGNRHCPACQQGKAYAWLARQLERQLPAHHFMLTFTVPEPLREFLRSHQRLGYGALFEASAGAIKRLAADPKHLGADTPGFFGVLHTWGRTPPTTRISITSSRAAHSIARRTIGILPAPGSICRCAPCRQSSGRNSAMRWTRRDCSGRLRHRCGRSTGM